MFKDRLGRFFENRAQWVLSKSQSYATLFLGPDNRRHGNAAVVWEDLRVYCQADEEGLVVSPVTRTADPIASAYRAGRRDVFKRLEKMTYYHLNQEKDNAGSIPSSTSDTTE